MQNFSILSSLINERILKEKLGFMTDIDLCLVCPIKVGQWSNLHPATILGDKALQNIYISLSDTSATSLQGIWCALPGFTVRE